MMALAKTSTTALNGWKGRVRERCARRTKLYGDRRHLSRGRGRRLCLWWPGRQSRSVTWLPGILLWWCRHWPVVTAQFLFTLTATCCLTTTSLLVVSACSWCTRQVRPQHRAVRSLAMSSLPLVFTGCKDVPTACEQVPMLAWSQKPVSFAPNADQSSFLLFALWVSLMVAILVSCLVAVCEQLLLPALSCRPCLEYSFHVPQTATYGLMLDLGVQWYGLEAVLVLDEIRG